MSRPTLSLAELEAFDPQAPAGARRRFYCPLCGQDKAKDAAHRCLSVETATGLWKCFRCDASGRLSEKWENRENRRARTTQALKQHFALNTPVSKTEAETPKPWREHLKGLQPLSQSAGEKYLAGRGISLEIAQAAGTKFSRNWLGRPAVVFPIRDAQGKLVAAQGRYCDGREDPKTRTVGPKKEGAFFTSDFWNEIRRGAPIIITEAPIDALSIAMCGFPTLALCGKSGAPSWLARHCAFQTVWLAFDADDAGEKGAMKLGNQLSLFGAKPKRLLPHRAKDWNEVLQHEPLKLQDFLLKSLIV